MIGFTSLLSPDAYVGDIKTLEAKGLQPSKFMTQIADAFFTEPCILPYEGQTSGCLSA